MKKIEITEVYGSAGRAWVVETRWEQEMRSLDEARGAPKAISAQHLVFDSLGSLISYLSGFLDAKPY